jgi:hypothetical protein
MANFDKTKPLSMEEHVAKLRQGKVQMAERCMAAAKAIAEEAGVETSEYTNGLHGHACPTLRHIEAPKPTTRRRLYVWAHECAHVALRHIENKPCHREEYEAEQWAAAALRRHGVPVPRKELTRAKKYVAMKIRRAELRGAKRIDAEARKWSRPRRR